jgi:hypothetical protein
MSPSKIGDGVVSSRSSASKSSKPSKASNKPTAREEHRRRRGERQRQSRIVLAVIAGILALIIVIAVASAIFGGPKYKTTASGLKYRIIEQGTGAKPQAGDTVAVIYTGKLQDGTVFDSTELHGGEPITFQLGVHAVIDGWDEGIALLNEGGKAELVIPPDLGYGPNGFPPTIPGNATLNFEVELVSVTPAGQ